MFCSQVLWRVEAARGLAKDPFYESDCQGRFSSLLIAFRLASWQSVPSELVATIVSAYGWAEQSCVSDSCSVAPSILSETILKRAGDHLEGVDHGSI